MIAKSKTAVRYELNMEMDIMKHTEIGFLINRHEANVFVNQSKDMGGEHDEHVIKVGNNNERVKLPSIQNILNACGVGGMKVSFKLNQHKVNAHENAPKQDLIEKNANTIPSNLHDANGSCKVRLQNLNVSLRTRNAPRRYFDQNLKGAVENFKNKGTIIDFVKTLNPSDAGKTVMDKLFNVLSDAGQKQGIWNSDSDITSSDKFINAYVKKVNDTLRIGGHYSGSGLKELFKVIPIIALNFSSPEDVKDKIENLFQKLNIGSGFSGEKRTRALRTTELIFTLTNLSRDKISIKNIDLKLVAQILNTHIFVKEEGKEEYRLFSKEAKARSVPIFSRKKISENYFQVVPSYKGSLIKEQFDRFSQALFLTRNPATGELTPWSGEDRKAWLENTHTNMPL